MKVRRRARKIALQSLYEIDSVSHNSATVLEQRLTAQSLPPEGEAFARALLNGVLANLPQLDEMIQTYAPEWPLEQMSVIDRNILRIAIYEFAINGDTPVKVAINEAVELAKIFGSASSRRFVNGVLGTLATQISLPHPHKTSAHSKTRR
ncbi:MAG: transcription antitermination factor NusB [Chloroflexota bacterium]|nr:transcription antitermination factor NusB [Chloroflexota bacterium]